MQQALLTVCLGHGLSGEDNFLSEKTFQCMLKQYTPSEQTRILRVLELCQKYGRVLSWCRVEKIKSRSVLVRVLSLRIEQILLEKVSMASDLYLDNINEIYTVLWEYEPFVDIILEFFIDNSNINEFLNRLYRDPSYCSKALFSEYLLLQKKLLIGWMCYSHLPLNPLDFWISKSSNGSLKFSVDKDRIPPIYSKYFVDKILFIGESMDLLVQSKKSTSDIQKTTQKLISEMYYRQPHQNDNTILEWNPTLVIASLDQVIHVVSKSLYSLFIDDMNLRSQLKLMHNLFFFKEGFYYRKFFSSYLKHGVKEELLNELFMDSVAPYLKSKIESDLLPLYHLYIQKTGLEDETIDDLHLKYQCQWPLTIFFTEDTLIGYDKIFQLLFRIKRRQFVLQRVWRKSLSSIRHKTNRSLPIDVNFFRNRLRHVFDVLDTYLRLNVILPELSTLETRMNETSDFETLRKLHHTFLTKITDQSLVNDSVFVSSVDALCKVCEFFCWWISGNQDVEGMDPIPYQTMVSKCKDIMEEWNRHYQYLFKYLTSVQGRLPQCSQLLFLLEFSSDEPIQTFDFVEQEPLKISSRLQDDLRVSLEPEPDTPPKVKRKKSLPKEEEITTSDIMEIENIQPKRKGSRPPPRLLERLMRKTGK